MKNKITLGVIIIASLFLAACTNSQEVSKNKYKIGVIAPLSGAGAIYGGQQQMLALARALIQSPELLLLDEPSLGLSPKAMQATFSMIQDINRRGVTVVLVEQNTKAALAIADQTLVLEGGKIVSRAG